MPQPRGAPVRSARPDRDVARLLTLVNTWRLKNERPGLRTPTRPICICRARRSPPSPCPAQSSVRLNRRSDRRPRLHLSFEPSTAGPRSNKMGVPSAFGWRSLPRRVQARPEAARWSCMATFAAVVKMMAPAPGLEPGPLRLEGGRPLRLDHAGLASPRGIEPPFASPATATGFGRRPGYGDRRWRPVRNSNPPFHLQLRLPVS